ncbi:alpha/beta fold hydrolase [Paraflavitalea sp. CAU 1676]|uniref:alpha/beta hydrolase n=1 Tax=Paraflavitalea sp. CAU 1676 TaxID=3032598 RepID=UPI0023DB017C|nr:alpha/beta fold hydrolase [Paraflavitalea sp. CAU 1676]MDF2186973.1 alpha/beta fold hydrolase [Paraflavitalea sp. CAU 1676]
MRILRRVLWTVLILFVLFNALCIFHAYRFTYFYDDAGAAIKKPEQMSGLEKTKVVLFGLQYPKSVNDAHPKLPYEAVSLTTSDTAHLRGWYMPRKQARGTVILFHGHGSSSGRVLEEAYYMHSLGFHTMLIDFRAHGNSDGHVSTIGYYEAADVKAAYDFVRKKGEQNIVLWGVSLGAATITRAIAVEGVKPEKIILELSYGTLYDAVKGRIRTMGLPERPLAGMLTFWGGAIRDFWAFGLDPQEYAKKIECPVLVQHGAKDSRVTLAETKAIYANIPHGRKKLVIYEQAKHESLCKREPEHWKKEIKDFLLQY